MRLGAAPLPPTHVPHSTLMTTNTIFFRTLSFCWLKLGLGILNIVIDALLLGLIMLFAIAIDIRKNIKRK